MKYLIVGDIHAGIKHNSKIFHNTLISYGKWLKKICEEKNIKNIIQLGDIFDNRTQISVETLQKVSDFFEILKDIEIDIVVGNHDCLYNENADVHSLSPFKNRKNIHIHDKVTIKNNMVFTGWGVKLEQIPECDYLFGHYDTVGFELQKNRISTHGFRAVDVMNKVKKMVFSGHYHRPQMKIYDKKPFYYSGSAFPLTWEDSDHTKYVYTLDTKTSKVQSIENDISPRFYYINSENQIDKVSGNFVAISFSSNEEGERWRSQIQNLAPLDIKTEIINEKVVQVENDISAFRIAKIEDILDEWPEKNLINLTDKQKKRVAQKAQKMYILKK